MFKTQLRNTAIMLVISIALVFGVAALTAKEEVHYTDGEYYATAEGNKEGIWVKVTLKDDVITAVEVLEHKETAGICEPAIEQVPAAIVAANSPYVDAVAGATKTSNGIKNAVENALLQAQGKADKVEYTAPTPKEDPTPLGYTYNPGVYTAFAEGFEEDIRVEVEFSETAIVRVTVLNSTDGEERISYVTPALTDEMIKWQTYAVDAECGATFTATGLINAVEDCVNQAKQ